LKLKPWHIIIILAIVSEAILALSIYYATSFLRGLPTRVTEEATIRFQALNALLYEAIEVAIFVLEFIFVLLTIALVIITAMLIVENTLW